MKLSRKVSLADKIDLRLSTGRVVDGLWVGSSHYEPKPGLRRVEDALRLIKDHSPLHYQRIRNNLERIWVRLLPHARASYFHPLNACQLDERFVVLKETTLERIASCIIHEATHGRLAKLGIPYDVSSRPQIERICLRRELHFAAQLPHGEALRDEITRTLDWCVDGNEYYSDQSMRQQNDQGNMEVLRYLGVPAWLVSIVFKARDTVAFMRHLTKQLVGRRG
jgi:hypothetical protein